MIRLKAEKYVAAPRIGLAHSIIESADQRKMLGGGPIVVEIRKGVFSRYPKKQTGSWSESDRGGIRLCEKVYKLLVKGKVFLDRIG